MHKATTKTTRKMLQIVNVNTYQGKLTYLMISFLYQTQTGFDEIVSLAIGDVYHHGRVKKAMIVGEGTERRTHLLDVRTRQIIGGLVELQAHHGLKPTAEAPLFRTPSGKAFTAEQLASIFWLYQEAAEAEEGKVFS